MEDDINILKLEAELNLLLVKDGLARPSLAQLGPSLLICFVGWHKTFSCIIFHPGFDFTLFPIKKLSEKYMYFYKKELQGKQLLLLDVQSGLS